MDPNSKQQPVGGGGGTGTATATLVRVNYALSDDGQIIAGVWKDPPPGYTLLKSEGDIRKAFADLSKPQVVDVCIALFHGRTFPVFAS